MKIQQFRYSDRFRKRIDSEDSKPLSRSGLYFYLFRRFLNVTVTVTVTVYLNTSLIRMKLHLTESGHFL